MNERIRELAKEALVEHCVSHVRLEKFAELIVRECINICDREYVAQIGTPASAHNSAIKKCRDNIAQHFGVEE
jgi:hypothetical protein